MTKTALVITSISSPNDVLKTCAHECHQRGMDFILIGDVSSPSNFELDGCDYWSIARQESFGSRMAEILPKRHYARKNLGYLVAMQQGAEIIIETDDDNFPREGFWQERVLSHKTPVISHAGWVNAYRYFTDTHIWPRGFPLDLVHKSIPALEELPEQINLCPIQQGLADENPDVDAVYRLILPLPQNFAQAAPVALSQNAWCPFNSQNTTWFRQAFPLLYLPSYCSFRMTDIWRSLVAQRIAWTNGWCLLFHGSTVWQERNEHNLMRDFADEVPGYLNNATICDTLERLDLTPGEKNIPENLLKCYRAIVDLGLIKEEELPLVEAWLGDIQRISG